jgi:hypothetical protein
MRHDAHTWAKVTALKAKGVSDPEISRRTGIPRSTIYMHFARQRERASIDTAATDGQRAGCYASGPQMDVLALEGTWSESTTWSGSPTNPTSSDNLFGTTTATLGYSGSCPSAWVSISGPGSGVRTMGALVNEWLIGGAVNYGIELRAHDETLTTTWRRFKSSEAGSGVPTLSVVYVTAATAMGMDTLPEAIGQYLVDEGANPDASPSYDGCKGIDYPVGEDPDNTVSSYKQYLSKVDNSTTENLALDEYWPASGSHPMIILVHGGGFWRGCRVVLAAQAYQLKQQGYVVLLIDYRIACDPTDHVLIGMGSTILKRCGWYYKTEDTATGFGENLPGAAFHDVLDAIKYGRDNINTDCGGCWDGTNVYMGGGSGGGTQAFMAAVKGFEDGGAGYQVDAAFGWSATLEMGDPTCGDSSNDSITCWTQENHYVCQDVLFPVLHAVLGEEDPACTYDTTWGNQNDYLEAAPFHAYTTSGGDLLPAIWFSNGGFCTPACPENIGYDGLLDLELNNQGNTTPCKVNTSEHAVQYLNDSNHHCLDHMSVVVFAANVNWLGNL